MTVMFSDREIETLRGWDRISSHFRQRYLSRTKTVISLKDIAFREVYGKLMKEAIQHAPKHSFVLKTDLWNEGVEDGRDLLSIVATNFPDTFLVGTDISQHVCESAKNLRRYDYQIVRCTLLASPFQTIFDFIIDASTVDHMPERLRTLWVSAESSMLKPGGTLLISFDNRLNLFTEMYHRFITRRRYPEWTLLPSAISLLLKKQGLDLVRSHAIFLVGLFWGTHRPQFPFSNFLTSRGILGLLMKLELSKHSRLLSFIAPQYVIVARKAKDSRKDLKTRS